VEGGAKHVQACVYAKSWLADALAETETEIDIETGRQAHIFERGRESVRENTSEKASEQERKGEKERERESARAREGANDRAIARQTRDQEQERDREKAHTNEQAREQQRETPAGAIMSSISLPSLAGSVFPSVILQ